MLTTFSILCTFSQWSIKIMSWILSTISDMVTALDVLTWFIICVRAITLEFRKTSSKNLWWKIKVMNQQPRFDFRCSFFLLMKKFDNRSNFIFICNTVWHQIFFEDWLLLVDFVMLNTNSMAKLAYHVKILRKLKLNVPKRAIFITRLCLLPKIIFLNHNNAILKCYLLYWKCVFLFLFLYNFFTEIERFEDPYV